MKKLIVYSSLLISLGVSMVASADSVNFNFTVENASSDTLTPENVTYSVQPDHGTCQNSGAQSVTGFTAIKKW